MSCIKASCFFNFDSLIETAKYFSTIGLTALKREGERLNSLNLLISQGLAKLSQLTGCILALSVYSGGKKLLGNEFNNNRHNYKY